MVVQVPLLAHFALRSESVWWNRNYVKEKHIEGVATHVIAVDFFQNIGLVAPEILKHVVDLFWVHVGLFFLLFFRLFALGTLSPFFLDLLNRLFDVGFSFCCRTRFLALLMAVLVEHKEFACSFLLHTFV